MEEVKPVQPAPPTPPPPPIPDTPVPAPIHKRPIKLIILITLVFILLAIVIGFLAFQRIQTTKPVEKQITTRPTLTPSAAPTPVYGRKLYSVTNNQLTLWKDFPELTDDSGRSLKRDGDYIYYTDQQVVSRFSLTTKKVESVYANSAQKTKVDSISVTYPYLYITIYPKDYEYEGNISMVEYNLETKASRTISPIPVVLYGGASYLFKAGSIDVLSSIGGDGCGGAGNIYHYNNNATKVILEVGIGCVNEPRLLGFNAKANELVLYSVIADDDMEENYDSVYTQNVLTGEKTPLYDLKKVSKILAVLLDQKTLKVIIRTENTFVVYDIQTKESETIPFESSKLYSIYLEYPKIYLTSKDYQTLTTFNFETQKAETKKLAEPFSSSMYDFQVLGVFNNALLFQKDR